MPDKIITASTNAFIDPNLVYTPEGAELRWHLAIAGLYGLLPGGLINNWEIEESYVPEGLEPQETKAQKLKKRFKKWWQEAFDEALIKRMMALTELLSRYIEHLDVLETFLDQEIKNLENADSPAAQELRKDLINAKAKVAEEKETLVNQDRLLKSENITEPDISKIEKRVEASTNRIQKFKNWIGNLFAKRTSNNTTEILAATAAAQAAMNDRLATRPEMNDFNADVGEEETEEEEAAEAPHYEL